MTFEIGDRVVVTTTLHPRCHEGRVGRVVACPCGLSHRGTVVVRPDGTKSLYRFAPAELRRVE